MGGKGRESIGQGVGGARGWTTGGMDEGDAMGAARCFFFKKKIPIRDSYGKTLLIFSFSHGS